MKDDPVLSNTTCFVEHKKLEITCEKSSCRNWMDSPEHLNCAIIGAEHGPWILQDIGKIFGVTRMRICQIEKEETDMINNVPIVASDPDSDGSSGAYTIFDRA